MTLKQLEVKVNKILEKEELSRENINELSKVIAELDKRTASKFDINPQCADDLLKELEEVELIAKIYNKIRGCIAWYNHIFEAD